MVRGKSKSKGKPRTEKKVDTEDVPNVKSDFKYIVRIADTDLDGSQDIVHALTEIKGIGVRVAESTVNLLGLSQHELIGNLSDDQIANIEKTLSRISENVPFWLLNRRKDWETGKDFHIYSSELDVYRRDDINLMKMIRCYRGIRHETGQKVRGQRTKSKGRTGLTVGVMRKTSSRKT
jgi:small subunit ribosomal protein S13